MHDKQYKGDRSINSLRNNLTIKKKNKTKKNKTQTKTYRSEAVSSDVNRHDVCERILRGHQLVHHEVDAVWAQRLQVHHHSYRIGLDDLIMKHCIRLIPVIILHLPT